jgi:hypothetical protein
MPGTRAMLEAPVGYIARTNRGRGGQSRTVTTSAQNSDACVTPHPDFITGGTERTRTVIGLVDNQVPHLSATVPCKLGGLKGVEPS